MKKLVNSEKLRNLMTLATDLNYPIFTEKIFYMGYYCLFSVAKVKEDMPSLKLSEGQTVVTSPMIDDSAINSNCTIYKTINIDIERGLLIPIISWAVEFTKHIASKNIPVYMKRCSGLIEFLLMQIWELEDVELSEEGLSIDLQSPVSLKSVTESQIRWDDHDSLVHAEAQLKNDLAGLLIPHAHKENINYFCKADINKGVIFDW